MTPTRGALRLAEILLPEGIDSKGRPSKLRTAFGKMTRAELATLIDEQTGAWELLEACKAVLNSIENTDLQGAVMWIKSPFQAGAIHETAWERLTNVIDKAEGS